MSHTGIDQSSYQDSTPIDYAAVKDYLASKGDGAQGLVLVKVSEGTGYVNPNAAADIEGYRAQGLLVHGYVFLHPDESLGPQIQLAIDNLHGCETLWIDLEQTGNLPWDAVAQIAQDALKGVNWHLVNSGLYSNGNFLSNMPGAPWGHPLWYADPDVPEPGRPCDVWQDTWTETVPGINGPVDGDVWRGTEELWLKLGGKAPEPTPVPPLPPTPVEPIVDVALPVLKPGDKNASVSSLRALLNAKAGYSLAIIDEFDAECERNVRSYQLSHDIRGDGIVGIITWNQLLRGPAG